ncbi:ATP-binding protein [Deinococcus cellulosilyticus]|uniref:Bacterial transcriptional activator domain-containing protein n=1 Tax=Deinococcus cellulosilyticus (strain DSM 18568 / NBRC 106333 / KACC 11606 / 5516J-15) TaxID=1223518 RepID=A0A511MY89_DEIC1|nr:NB-ARC domain-containing protein [Deinococcus cellulosilyticus]GEM45560.1 hypothetical protein DC3_11950 [Deinococcus cellulosilyticus NBRC 106333 = KACC 11606]
MTVDLQYLGPFNAKIAQQDIRVPTRKCWALLLYLSLHPGWHAREQVADLLWPQGSVQQGRTSLRKAIGHLRAIPADSEPLVLATREQVQWNSSVRPSTDLDRLNALLQQHLLTPAGLDEVEALIRGPFLQGFSMPTESALEELLEVRRVQVHRALDSRLQHHVTTQVEQKRLKEAIRLLQCRLKLDPLLEDAYLQWMDLLLQQDHVQEARQVHQELTLRFQQELGLQYPQGWETLQAAHLTAQVSTAKPAPVPTEGPQWIPEPMTSFVGRARERQELRDLLGRPHCRLLTVHGSGGVGKTRLVLKLLQDQPLEGYTWLGIPVENLTTVEEVQLALFSALSLVSSETGDLMQPVVQYLQDRQVVLVLDNTEHLPQEPLRGWIRVLLGATRHLKVVLTSRRVLNLEMEYIYSLQGMGLQAQTGLLSEALQFLQTRLEQSGLEAVPSNFAPLQQICTFLAGNPLALEMVAGWLKCLTAEDVVHLLQTGSMQLEFASHHAAVRHRSMQDVIEHSVSLLDPPLKDHLIRLGVFQGGWTLQGAAPLGIHLRDLRQLMDASLIHFNQHGRYHMQPLVHLYCEQHLSQHPDAAALRQGFCVSQLQALQQLQVPMLDQHQVKAALDQIEQEWLNLRAALAQVDGQENLVLTACWLLTQHAELRGQFLSAIQLLEGTLLRQTDGRVRSQIRGALSYLYMRVGWIAASMETGMSEVTPLLGMTDLESHWACWTLLQGLASCEMQKGHMGRALEWYGQAEELSRHDVHFSKAPALQDQARFRNAISHIGMALILIDLEHWERARLHLQDAQRVLKGCRSPYWCYLYWVEGRILHRTGHSAHALDALRTGATLAQHMGYHTLLLHIKKDLGDALLVLGHHMEARRVLEEGFQLSGQAGNTWAGVDILHSLGEVYEALNQPAAALKAYQEAIQCAGSSGVLHFATRAIERALVVLRALGRDEQAQLLESWHPARAPSLLLERGHAEARGGLEWIFHTALLDQEPPA